MQVADRRAQVRLLPRLGPREVRRVAVLADPQRDVRAEPGERHHARAHERGRLHHLLAGAAAGQRNRGPDEAGVDLQADVPQRRAEGRRAARPELLPERAIVLRQPAPGEREAHGHVGAACRVQRRARGDDPAHDRLAHAGIRAVGGVGGDRQVGLVDDGQRDERRAPREHRRGAAHERRPGRLVALLAGGHVVADLHLDAEPERRVAVGQRGDAREPLLALGREQAAEPDHERAARRTQIQQRAVQRRLVRCGGRLLRQPDAAGRERRDAEAQRMRGLCGGHHRIGQAEIPAGGLLGVRLACEDESGEYQGDDRTHRPKRRSWTTRRCATSRTTTS